MTPAQISRSLMSIPNPGKCVVFTMVHGKYLAYIPLFLYMVRRAYPEYTIHVFAVNPEKDKINGLVDLGVSPIELPVKKDMGYFTATMRFLHCDNILSAHEYCLITDIDMMIVREDMNIVDQHMLDLRRNNLDCYSNYINNGDRCPGVHFVTKEWWNKTEEQRDMEKDFLLSIGSIPYDYDEKILLRIIRESGLKEPPSLPNLWTFHGEHLGDWRRRIQNRDSFNMPRNAVAVDVMLNEPEFMELVSIQHEKEPSLLLKETFERMRNR